MPGLTPTSFNTVAELPDDKYHRDHKTFFGSVHATLNHLLLVDILWRNCIENVAHEFDALDVVLYEDFYSLRQAREEEDKNLIRLVEGMSESKLIEETIFNSLASENQYATRNDHILINLFNHQTHHRGRVHCLLTQNDLIPPPLDINHYFEDTMPECIRKIGWGMVLQNPTNADRFRMR